MAPAAAGADRDGPEWRLDGRVAYPAALETMERRAAEIAAGQARELVWLLEHPPTLTGGTSARDVDLLDPHGIALHRVGRGGQWTYHGPGQVTGYVLLDLAHPHGTVPPRDVRAYVGGLESWLIATLARFGVAGERRADRVGIWVVDPRTGAEDKIAAIGVRVTRWVTWHGVALNVSPDLRAYDRIVPCGIAAHGVTSLARLGVHVGLPEVTEAMRISWPETFGFAKGDCPLPGLGAAPRP